MKIPNLLLLIFLISFVIVACEESGDGEGGSVTIKLTGSGAQPGVETLAGIFLKGYTPATDPLAVAGEDMPGNGETASFTLEKAVDGDPTGEVWYADKDTAYDLYIFIDVNEPDNDEPSNGDLSSSDFFPKQIISINSDMIINTGDDVLIVDIDTYM